MQFWTHTYQAAGSRTANWRSDGGSAVFRYVDSFLSSWSGTFVFMQTFIAWLPIDCFSKWIMIEIPHFVQGKTFWCYWKPLKGWKNWLGSVDSFLSVVEKNVFSRLLFPSWSSSLVQHNWSCYSATLGKWWLVDRKAACQEYFHHKSRSSYCL